MADGTGLCSHLRAAFHQTVSCNRCFEGATSHDCALPYCVDERWGGHVFTQLMLSPFFDPTEIPVVFADYNDYPTASAGLCLYVANASDPPDPEQCAPFPEFPGGFSSDSGAAADGHDHDE